MSLNADGLQAPGDRAKNAALQPGHGYRIQRLHANCEWGGAEAFIRLFGAATGGGTGTISSAVLELGVLDGSLTLLEAAARSVLL